MSTRFLKEPTAELDRSAARIDIERVLEAAARQFAELGFDGVSMREISRECGCPAPSIYYHFTSKSNLYKEAYSHKIEQTMDLMAARLEPVKDRRVRFETMIETFHDLFTGDRTLLLLMQRDVIDVAATRRPFLSRRQYDHFTSLIQGLASELKDAPVARETAFTIGALVFGYCELSMMAREIYDQPGPNLMQEEKRRLVAAATALVSIG